MKQKEVTIIRKKGTPFKVNYPADDRVKTYAWNGTVGTRLDKKNIPFEVYDWLAQYTTTFSEGELVIDKTNDEEVLEVKEGIDNIQNIENAILTKHEIKEILTKGNHLSLKKKLDELVKNQPYEVTENQKRYIVGVASEIGIDSNSKRKILCEWAGINYENSDLVFDKNLKEMYEED